MSLLKPNNIDSRLKAQSPDDKIQVAISACLLGHQVRYDAKILPKLDQSLLAQQLHLQPEQLILIPFCPEVGIGLSVPRAKIQAIRNKEQQIRVLGVVDHTLDVTERLESYAHDFIEKYPEISTFVVKSKSPANCKSFTKSS